MASQIQTVTGNKENQRNYTCRVLENLQSINPNPNPKYRITVFSILRHIRPRPMPH